MIFNRFLSGVMHGIIPAILITLPIGSVYAFSNFSGDIAAYIGCSVQEIQLAFALSILFLGLGAAFFGKLVENNIKRAGFISSILFTTGTFLTAYGIYIKNLYAILIGYGVINGIAEGIGYLTPVKTLTLWFKKFKGLASAISIVSFGLGSSLCVLLSNILISREFPLYKVFYILGLIYYGMMIVGVYLLAKPAEYQQPTNANQPGSISSTSGFYRDIFKDKFFWHSWFFMFLNISAGLVLIGATKNIFSEFALSNNDIVILLMLCGVCNGGGRLVIAGISDFLLRRINIWLIISLISFVILFVSFFYYPAIIFGILFINMLYGGGFSTCPSVLLNHYGSSNLSKIHGLVLSAWGIASIPAFFITKYVFVRTSENSSFWVITGFLAGIYFINLVNVFLAKRTTRYVQ